MNNSKISTIKTTIRFVRGDVITYNGLTTLNGVPASNGSIDTIRISGHSDSDISTVLDKLLRNSPDAEIDLTKLTGRASYTSKTNVVFIDDTQVNIKGKVIEYAAIADQTINDWIATCPISIKYLGANGRKITAQSVLLGAYKSAYSEFILTGNAEDLDHEGARITVEILGYDDKILDMDSLKGYADADPERQDKIEVGEYILGSVISILEGEDFINITRNDLDYEDRFGDQWTNRRLTEHVVIDINQCFETDVQAGDILYFDNDGILSGRFKSMAEYIEYIKNEFAEIGKVASITKVTNA